MTTPEVVRCFDNYFRRVIYSLSTYIADYPEQALLTCIVQGWCPRCVCFRFFTRHHLHVFRCTTGKNNLENPGGRRSNEHTELLVRALELGELWEDYGLVGDIIVCSFFFFVI